MFKLSEPLTKKTKVEKKQGRQEVLEAPALSKDLQAGHLRHGKQARNRGLTKS